MYYNICEKPKYENINILKINLANLIRLYVTTKITF